MKKLLVEIEFSDEPLEVFMEEGESEEDYKGAAKQKELKQFRIDFVKDVRRVATEAVKDYFRNEDGTFLEFLLDSDVSIEGFESLKDYGISIKIVESK